GSGFRLSAEAGLRTGIGISGSERFHYPVGRFHFGCRIGGVEMRVARMRMDENVEMGKQGPNQIGQSEVRSPAGHSAEFFHAWTHGRKGTSNPPSRIGTKRL